MSVTDDKPPAPPRKRGSPRPTRLARFLPQALVGQSLEAGVVLARRFGQLRNLPEHPLFPSIHGRLIAGESTYRLARWIQAQVPFDDPLGPATIQVQSLERKLRRYKAMMPKHMLAPVTHLDEITNGAVIEIDVVKELGALISYQKQRISQFAKREAGFPLGMTSEQQRKEVMTLRDLLTTMRDTQIALGLVPVGLPSSMTLALNTVDVNTSDDDSDPLSRFLADFPEAIPGVMGAIDDAVAQVTAGSNGHIPHVGSADD